MKTFKVKNYKGNLVESLSRFQKSHKGMKIVEACEDGDDLKIKAEESEKLEEATGKKIYALVDVYEGENEDEVENLPYAICSSIEKAKRIAKEYNEKFNLGLTFHIYEYPLDAFCDAFRVVAKAK